MNRVLAGLLLVAAILMSACASYDGRPAQAFFDVEPEYKLKSAKHWRVVANDVGRNIRKAVKGPETQVHVPIPTEPSSIFNRVFASQLRSSLFDNSVVVTPYEAGAHSVQVTVDTVRHVTLPDYIPGSLSILAVGVKVLRESQRVGAPLSQDLGQAVVAGGTDAALTYREDQKRPSLEVVLTTSITYQGRYVFHSTDTYYLDDVDACLFRARAGHCNY
jgi:hypothetical protein